MTDHRYLAVDRRNLFSWLSRGVIVPRVLMDKYRPDALDTALSRLPMASEAAVGLLIGSAEYPVAVELAPEVDFASTVGDPNRAVLLARGAVSTNRIARVHVRTPSEADEIKARAYRGFDAGDLDVSVTPTLFENERAEPAWTRDPAVTDTPPDDLPLRHREAVAGAVMSMFSGEPDAVDFPGHWLMQDEAEDSVGLLVQAAQSSGLIKRQDDFHLLRGTLDAIYSQSGEGAIVPSALLAQIADTVPDSRVVGLNKQLNRILELTQGEDELKPFKVQGGLLTTKALLLYLLRPDPEAVRGWSEEDLNAERQVLQLSRLLAGFGSRYSGLPSALRVGAGANELLDWVASGIQPSDFRIPIDTTQKADSPAAAPLSNADANPAVVALRKDVAAGDYKQALAVAQALEWGDCLQLQVTADSFDVTAASGRALVTFAPGSVLIWSLLQDAFLDHLANLKDNDLQAALKPNRAASRRASAKPHRRVGSETAGKEAQGRVGTPAEHVDENEGPVGPSSYR